MARTAEAKVKITTKDDTKKGLSSAQKGLLSFKKNISGINKSALSAAKGITSLVKGISGIGIAMAGIASIGFGFKGIMDSVTAFNEAEKASIALATAIRNSPLMDGSAYTGLTNYTKGLQKVSIYEDDLLNAQAQQLISMGLTEQQTKDVLAASVDLASSGVMPLEEATEALGKTYMGIGTSIGKSIPALKGMTKEQLINGEAVQYVAKAYKGMGSAIASTNFGKVEQFKNQLGDLKESLGSSLSIVGSSILKALEPAIEKMTKWLEENRYRIAAFFLNIPELAAIAFDALKAIFTDDNLFNLVCLKWWFSIKAWEEKLNALMTALGKTMFEPMKWAWDMLIFGFKVGISSFVNFFIDGINTIIENLNKLITSKLFQAVFHNQEGIKLVDRVAPPVSDVSLDPKKRMDAIWAEFQKTSDAISENEARLQGVANKVLAKEFGDIITPFGKKMNDLLNKEAANIEAREVSAQDIANGAKPETTIQAPKSSFWDTLKAGLSSVSNVSGFSAIPAGFASGMDGVMGMITSAMGPLASAFSSLAGPVALLQPVIEAMVGVLAPAVNIVIAPLMNALKAIGTIAGQMLLPILDALSPIFGILAQMLMTAIIPVFQILTPIIQVLASIIEIVLTPILKGMAVVFEILRAPVKFVGDLFTWVADTIKTAVHNLKEYLDHPFEEKNRNIIEGPGAFTSDAFTGLADRIRAIWEADYSTNTTGENSWEDIFDGITIATDPTATSDNGASYSGSQEIYITIQNDGVLVGENGMEAFALIVRKEFQKLDYYSA